jgi:hypothetical protein
VEAQFSTVIYEAFQNAVKNPNLLQVITIFYFFSNPLYVTTYKSSAGDHRMSQLFRGCTQQSAPTVRARTSSPRPNSICALSSAPKDSTCSRAVYGSRPKLSAPTPVPACARSCSGSRPTGFCGQPPHIANRHVGGQQ